MLKQPDEIRGAYSSDRTAEDYVDTRFASAWGSVMHRAQVKVVNDVIRTEGVRHVLEIAPGPARLSVDVHGFERGLLCEFNESMLQVARRRLAHNDRWAMVRGDGFHVPVRRAAGIDLVYTFRFIRHFELPERERLYREIRELLGDGGLFIFDAVNVGIDRGAPEQYGIFDQLYDRPTLERELQDHGFEPLSFTPVIRHMALQQQIQILVGPRSTRLARLLIQALEAFPGEPLEWVVVSRKRRTSPA